MNDNRDALRERLEAVTGERISALEAVEPAKAKSRNAARDGDYGLGRENNEPETREQDQAPIPQVEKVPASKRIEPDLGL